MGKFYDAKEHRDNSSAITGLMIALGICLAFMVILAVFGIVDGEPHITGVCTAIGIILIIEMIFFIRIKKMSERTNRYEMILEEDHDGVITFARLSELTGIPEARIRKDFLRMQNGKFKIIRIEGDNIILGTAEDYEDIICPTCGATNRVRAGSSDKCNNCGSYLRRA